MATVMKILLFLVTILLPGGLIVVPLYYLWRRHRRPDLDFSDQFRRVPLMRDRRAPLIVTRPRA